MGLSVELAAGLGLIGMECVFVIRLSPWISKVPSHLGLAIIEVGRELAGVPFGVLRGVEEALSTRALREPDLGVMFELRKFLTGVLISSPPPTFGVALLTVPCSFLMLGDDTGFGEPAARGVMYVPTLPRIGAFGVVTGLPVKGGFLVSYGISRRIIDRQARRSAGGAHSSVDPSRV